MNIREAYDMLPQLGLDEEDIQISVLNPSDPEAVIKQIKGMGYAAFLRSSPLGIEVVIAEANRETTAT